MNFIGDYLLLFIFIFEVSAVILILDHIFQTVSFLSIHSSFIKCLQGIWKRLGGVRNICLSINIRRRQILLTVFSMFLLVDFPLFLKLFFPPFIIEFPKNWIIVMCFPVFINNLILFPVFLYL